LEAGEMHVIDVRFRLIKMLLAIQVHQVELIDEAQSLQKFERPVHRGPIDTVIAFARQCQ
jgi:hypothetical protein